MRPDVWYDIALLLGAICAMAALPFLLCRGRHDV